MARYLTTTLPYVNADPHIGFALELVEADALARSWRAQGEEVFFTTGTDEHGQKILKAAEAAGESVADYTDRYAGQFEKLKAALLLANDAFIRTTEPRHYAAAQELWRRCDAAGDIYKKKYRGLYCVGDEAYVKESDLVDGKCPNHPTLDLVEIEEENYFFRLSAYQDRLLGYLERTDCIVPDWRRQEAINFVRAGLEDFSISRDKARMSWGVPVPGDDAQVMYVWFDALANYISTLGWPADEEGNFKKFWEEGRTLQVAGKDQVRFQSVMWQAMLMSAAIKTTDQVFYHGFITSGGTKMSKSIGNVISPYELVEKYGTEATRYLLLRHVHPTEDSDVTWERMDEWYTADLVNGLGNVVARITKMAEDNLDKPASVQEVTFKRIAETRALHHVSEDMRLNFSLGEALDNFEFYRAMGLIWSYIQALDERITAEEPFKLIKTDSSRGKELITQLVKELHAVGMMLEPFMPTTSKSIIAAVNQNMKPENLFPRLA
ncbi:MAG TPA: methionine--tRNA ligase [Candidatus Paceibacterota bacterium]|nr:methionine--tRNA ligase [Candidatus Paceibacterota bacterium]